MSVVFALLVACTGAPSTPEPGEAPVLDDPDALDTGFAPGDFGAYHIWSDVGAGTTRGGAVALEVTPGCSNLIEAIVDPSGSSPCLPPIPAVDGDFVDFVPAPLDRAQLRSRFLGESVTYGLADLPLVQDPDTQTVYYEGPASFDDIANSSVGPSWGGAWPTYASEGDLTVTEPLDLLQPAIGSTVQFTNHDELLIEWTPRGEGGGFVTLLVSSRFGFDRLYRLADDGLFSLDVTTLPWGSRVQEADFELTRWERTEIVRFGHVVELVAKSSARFAGQYLEVGPREGLRAIDACAQAAIGPSLVPGNWWYAT
ncbi:MAG: hypothetical protein AAF602_30750, partial [Myxococcota bacterium]